MTSKMQRYGMAVLSSRPKLPICGVGLMADCAQNSLAVTAYKPRRQAVKRLNKLQSALPIFEPMPITESLDLAQDRKLILAAYRRLLKALRPDTSKGDKRLIRRSFEIALEAHKDMRRKSGEPYIMHPLAVASIVAKDMGLGTTAVVCALLHDTVEDTELTVDDVRTEFGNKVAEIVDGLTKIATYFDLHGSVQADNFKKLLLTMAQDVRVILIKIADRLHNMRTMDHMPRQKQLRVASETTYLYAPLAHRLGLYHIKTELEDLALRYTERDVYRDINKKLQDTKSARTRFINEFCRPLKARLKKEGIKARVYGRSKAISSIYNKMRKKGVEFEDVYDLFAVRVVIETPPENEKADCWRVYSIVADIYQPNPARLRDWITIPKSNGYESLHTTVMGPRGRWVEVQIRSERMEEVAEKGFAAHWKYKEESSSDHALDEWLQQVREALQNPEANALDFLDDFKFNLFNEEIRVFTPKGDLIQLPVNSTALDFAYHIHTAVGNTTIGAKVNHKLVPISTRLRNGDQVEIITSRKQHPREDWLNLVHTGRARSKIKSALKEQKRLVAEEGKDILQRKMKALKVEFTADNIGVLVKYFGLNVPHDLYYGIATKQIDPADIRDLRVSKGKFELPPPKQVQVQQQEAEVDPGLVTHVRRGDELLIFDESAEQIRYQIAPCCNPIAGDDVFGFVTSKGEIKIHRTNCPNAESLLSNYGYRVVRTKWTSKEELAFLTGLRITGLDDVGVMNRITNVISGEMQVNIRSISVDSGDGVFDGKLTVYVKNKEQLEALIKRLKGLEGIYTVTRMDN